MNLEKLGDIVKARRNALGMTQSSVLRRTRLSAMHLYQIEHGMNAIGSIKLCELGAALGTTGAALLAQAEDAGDMVISKRFKIHFGEQVFVISNREDLQNFDRLVSEHYRTATFTEKAIDLFREMNRAAGWGYDTPDGARNNCGDASEYFLQLLTMGNIPAEIVSLTGQPEYAPLPDDHAEGGLCCHVVVKYDDWYIDWTRRQYIPDAGFPHIATLAEMEAEGWKAQHKEAAPTVDA